MQFYQTECGRDVASLYLWGTDFENQKLYGKAQQAFRLASQRLDRYLSTLNGAPNVRS